jgi:outer membrane protein TolC
MKLISFVLLLAAPVFAVEPLEQWIEAALKENPGLVAAQKKWEAARAKVPQARSLPDPMFGVDVERDSTRFNSYMNTEWMLSQKLPWPGKLSAKGKVAALDAEVIGFHYLEQMRQVKAQVISAYWDLWLAQRAVALTTENRGLMEQFEKIARVRYESGKGMQPDVLRAQVELATMGNELVTMEREVPVMRHALNTLLNAEPDTVRAADKPVFLPPLTQTLEQMQAQARQYCCILMSFIRAKQARDAGIRVAKLENKPEFEVRVEARQFEGRSGIQEYDTGVFINIPWLWRGKYKGMVNEARAEMEMADAELQAEINMTMLEIKETYTKADAALRLMALYEKDLLPKAKQLIEATRAAYETGTVTFLELVEAQKAWRDAQLAYYRAMADHGKSRAKLDATTAPWGEREFATGLVTPEMK